MPKRIITLDSDDYTIEEGKYFLRFIYNDPIQVNEGDEITIIHMNRHLAKKFKEKSSVKIEGWKIIKSYSVQG
jgi:hypothetical protein